MSWNSGLEASSRFYVTSCNQPKIEPLFNGLKCPTGGFEGTVSDCIHNGMYAPHDYTPNAADGLPATHLCMRTMCEILGGRK